MDREQMTPETWFHKNCTQYVVVQMLYHLSRTGVISCIYENAPISSSELAKKMNLNEPVLESILDYIYNVEEFFTRSNGKYGFTEFGQKILKRYGTTTTDGKHHFNFFDVRVGCYGPVWQEIGDLVTGKKTYGKEVHRAGEIAVSGLHKLTKGFVPSLSQAINELNPKAIAEMGVSSGLLPQLTKESPNLKCYGIDRSEKALKLEQEFATSEGAAPIIGVQAELFDPYCWKDNIAEKEGVLFFSIHFHEFLAQGNKVVIEFLKKMTECFPGSYVAATEQPRIPFEKKEDVSEFLWLYSNSNILIHHFIGNGKILTDKEWQSVFEEAGCKKVKVEPTNYLGYNLYLYKL